MAKKTKASAKKNSGEIEQFDLFNNTVVKEEPENKDDDFSVEKLSPFTIINMMFNDVAGFYAISRDELAKHFFMINRAMAVKYPLQAQFFNVNGINQADVVHLWQKFIRSAEPGKRTPAFVRDVGMKKVKSIESIDQSVVTDYCKFYSLSKKDFRDMLHFFYDATVDDINNFISNHYRSEILKKIKSKKM